MREFFPIGNIYLVFYRLIVPISSKQFIYCTALIWSAKNFTLQLLEGICATLKFAHSITQTIYLSLYRYLLEGCGECENSENYMPLKKQLYGIVLLFCCR